MQILQLNFQVAVSCTAYEKDCAPVAEAIAKVPGLIWKVWTYNEKTGVAGGIYLFESKEALSAYLEGPIIEGLKESPAFGKVSIRRFDILPELSRVTRFDVEKQAGRELEAMLKE